MGKHVGHTAQFLHPQWAVLAVALAMLSHFTPLILDAIPKQTPSPRKPFADIASFRPQYMREHQNATSVSLHATGTSIIMVLLLANPELIGALVFALKCGQLAFAALRHLDHGAVEGAFVLMVFFVTNKFLGGSIKRALAVLVIGYAFAWVGHFFFELNKPATFVYPTFSLVCDFLMWAEIVTGMTIWPWYRLRPTCLATACSRRRS